MRVGLLTGLLLALAACAQNQPTAATSSAQTPAGSASGTVVAQQVCRRVQPTGSSIPITQCTSDDDRKGVQQLRDDLDRFGQGGAFAKAPTPGGG